jgi:hypothetical protein
MFNSLNSRLACAGRRPDYRDSTMTAPLMPKATAVWLVENTSLTFEQIADFCGLHPLEIQAIADGEVANQMQGLDPVANGQTTAEEIARCQADPQARLKLSAQALPPQLFRHKGPRYTPIAKRQDKPDAIAFLLKSYPEMTEAQISKLIGTTKPTIAAVRDRTHWNSSNIKPRHPVELGLCTFEELEDMVARRALRPRSAARKRRGRRPKPCCLRCSRLSPRPCLFLPARPGRRSPPAADTNFY